MAKAKEKAKGAAHTQGEIKRRRHQHFATMVRERQASKQRYWERERGNST